MIARTLEIAKACNRPSECVRNWQHTPSHDKQPL